MMLSPQQIAYMSDLAKIVGPIHVGDQDVDYSIFIAPEGYGESLGFWVSVDGILDDGAGEKLSQAYALARARKEAAIDG